MHGVCIALDGDIQSCESDEATYHEALVHPAVLLHNNPKQVLIMGGGKKLSPEEIQTHPLFVGLITLKYKNTCRKG
ncbi:MAG: hypothetical protein ABFS56_11200 [Pseudomonadota bacterium]